MRLAAVLAVALLSGCGPSLGRYEITTVDLVDIVPQTEFFAQPGRDAAYGPFLRVELRSDFDLVADGNGNIYAFKTACGFFGEEERMVFGPFAAGDPPTDLYDAEPAMLRGADGKAAYLLYVPVSVDPRVASSGVEPLRGYDLATEPGDLCIKITQAGYFITESRSEVIRIPRVVIAKTLSP